MQWTHRTLDNEVPDTFPNLYLDTDDNVWLVSKSDKDTNYPIRGTCLVSTGKTITECGNPIVVGSFQYIKSMYGYKRYPHELCLRND